MTVAYLSIGSNLSSPLFQVNSSIIALGKMPKSHIIAISCYYRTTPLGPTNQPDYLNTAIALETNLNANVLLHNIKCIEQKQKRKRNTNNRWGPRTIDIDIMLFGKEVINTPHLTIPHYDMHNRSFMLWPLFEIAPKLCFPNGEKIENIITYSNIKKPSHW